MAAIFDLIGPGLFLYAVCVTLVAGFVKGAVGFAMPLIMISGMGILMAPDIALAAIILPIVFSNGLQVLRAGRGEALSALAEHWRYTLVVCVMILISAQFVRAIPPDALYFVLGVPVVGLSLIQLVGWRPRISPQTRRPFEWVAGFLSGTLGGLAGTWGPPTVLYLIALETPKQRQMAVQGVIYGLGSVMLLLGHLRSGILNAETVWLSGALLLPALLGMWVGFKLVDRFDQERFRKVTLLVLTVAGLNLIRRGIMG
jgi:uncharacterized membrane protein YfcA